MLTHSILYGEYSVGTQCRSVPKLVLNCYNTAYGYIWRYIDDNDYSYKHKSEKVILQIDIKTNKIINKFESITKAAKFVNVSISSISAALTGKSKTCKNFIWKYDAIER